MKKLQDSEQKILDKHLEQLQFDIKRGFLQFTVLSLINKSPKYAYEIKEEIYQVTSGAFDIDRNNLYKKLRTLEAEGILSSTEEPSDQGANRKYYSLTSFGRRFLKEISELLVPVIDSFYENISKLR
ncbi:MAG: PadR family transcriptional regulator [Deltaproteobacteria bacterium]|nr:PadR family transcriptional regulator [Deltaproteobacteria bacterium]